MHSYLLLDQDICVSTAWFREGAKGTMRFTTPIKSRSSKEARTKIRERIGQKIPHKNRERKSVLPDRRQLVAALRARPSFVCRVLQVEFSNFSRNSCVSPFGRLPSHSYSHSTVMHPSLTFILLTLFALSFGGPLDWYSRNMERFPFESPSISNIFSFALFPPSTKINRFRLFFLSHHLGNLLRLQSSNGQLRTLSCPRYGDPTRQSRHEPNAVHWRQ